MASRLWWNGASYGSPGLCVTGATFLQSEATSCTTLSEVPQLPLPGFDLIGWGTVIKGKKVHTSVALFFSVGLATMNTDHLGWNVVSAIFQSIG